MALWAVIEVFKDEELLLRVRKELEALEVKETMENTDIEILINAPLLQSIYSELMRLRVEVQTIFISGEADIHVNEWRIPKESLIVVPAGAAHRDPTVWNTRDGQHPLDQFWADRFLVYPGDPRSGPRKPIRSTVNRPATALDHAQGSQPKFASSGLADSYMAFDIGERTCPGRGFARKGIIIFIALIVARYDIELSPARSEYGAANAFYGIGTQRAKDKTPFRIRTRVRQDVR